MWELLQRPKLDFKNHFQTCSGVRAIYGKIIIFDSVRYLVVAWNIGDFDPVEDAEISAVVVKMVKTVAESGCDLQTFCSELKMKLVTRFEEETWQTIFSQFQKDFFKIATRPVLDLQKIYLL